MYGAGAGGIAGLLLERLRRRLDHRRRKKKGREGETEKFEREKGGTQAK